MEHVKFLNMVVTAINKLEVEGKLSPESCVASLCRESFKHSGRFDEYQLAFLHTLYELHDSCESFMTYEEIINRMRKAIAEYSYFHMFIAYVEIPNG
jgi:hypothetical protein